MLNHNYKPPPPNAKINGMANRKIESPTKVQLSNKLGKVLMPVLRIFLRYAKGINLIYRNLTICISFVTGIWS